MSEKSMLKAAKELSDLLTIPKETVAASSTIIPFAGVSKEEAHLNLKLTEDESRVAMEGTPVQLVELIATVMINNDVAARLILAAVDVFHIEKGREE